MLAKKYIYLISIIIIFLLVLGIMLGAFFMSKNEKIQDTQNK